MIQKKPMGENLHVIIGLPMRAMPSQEIRSKFFYIKRDKMVDGTPEGFASPIPPSMEPIFVGRRQVIPSHLANRFGS